MPSESILRIFELLKNFSELEQNNILSKTEIYNQRSTLSDAIYICIAKADRQSEALRYSALLLANVIQMHMLGNPGLANEENIINGYNYLLFYALQVDEYIYQANNLESLLGWIISYNEISTLHTLANKGVRLYNSPYLLSFYNKIGNNINPLLSTALNIICTPPTYIEPAILTEQLIVKPAPETPVATLPITEEAIHVKVVIPEIIEENTAVEEIIPEIIPVTILEATPEAITEEIPELAITPELVITPEPIVLTIDQQIDEYIKHHNATEFNQLLSTYPDQNSKQEILSHLKNRLLEIKYKNPKLREFILDINLDIQNCAFLLESKKTADYTKIALLEKIITFDDRDFHKFAPKHILNIAAPFKNFYTEIFNAVKQKIRSSTPPETALGSPTSSVDSTPEITRQSEMSLNPKKTKITPAPIEKQDLFSAIENTKTGKQLNFRLIKNLKQDIDKTNSDGQTAVMLALQKKLAVDTILNLIEESDRSMLCQDNLNQQNALHYWANYYNSNSPKIIGSLWQKFKQASKQHGSQKCPIYELNFKPDTLGENFMHTLLRNPSIAEEQVLDSLVILYSKTDKDIAKDEAAIYACLLRRNIDGEIPTFNLLNKKIDWPSTSFILNAAIHKVSLLISECYNHASNIFFPENQEMFFSNKPHDQHPIYTLLEKGQVLRVLNILKRQAQLRNGIIGMYNILLKRVPEPNKPDFVKAHKKFMTYLGDHELLWMQHGEQSLYSYIVNKMSATPNNLGYLDFAEFLADTEKLLPLNDSISWRNITRHLNGEKLNEQQLYACSANLAGMANEPDATETLPLQYAVLENSPKMVNFLVKNCHAKITERILAESLVLSEDNFKLFDLLHELNNNDISNKTSFNIYSYILQLAPNTYRWIDKYNYLISKGFNPAATDHRSVNLLQQLIYLGTKENEQHIIAKASALLQNPETRQKIISNIDTDKASAIEYLVNSGLKNRMSKQSIFELYKLILNNTSSLDFLVPDRKFHFLCAVITMNDIEALKITIAAIEKEPSIIHSIASFRMDSLNLLELAERTYKQNTLETEALNVEVFNLFKENFVKWSEIYKNDPVAQTMGFLKQLLARANQQNQEKIPTLIKKILSDSTNIEPIITCIDHDRNTLMDYVIYAKVRNRISKATAFELYDFMFDHITSLDNVPNSARAVLFQLMLLDHVSGLDAAIEKIEQQSHLIPEIVAFQEEGCNLLDLAHENHRLTVLSKDFLNLFKTSFEKWSQSLTNKQAPINKIAITNKLSM